MELIAAALEETDDDSHCDELQTEVLPVGGSDAVAEMTSNDVGSDIQSLDVPMQATSQPLVVVGEEAAVRQQEPLELEVTPPKRRVSQ